MRTEAKTELRERCKSLGTTCLLSFFLNTAYVSALDDVVREIPLPIQHEHHQFERYLFTISSVENTKEWHDPSWYDNTNLLEVRELPVNALNESALSGPPWVVLQPVYRQVTSLNGQLAGQLGIDERKFAFFEFWNGGASCCISLEIYMTAPVFEHLGSIDLQKYDKAFSTTDTGFKLSLPRSIAGLKECPDEKNGQTTEDSFVDITYDLSDGQLVRVERESQPSC